MSTHQPTQVQDHPPQVITMANPSHLEATGHLWNTLSRFKADLPAEHNAYFGGASLYGFIRGGISDNVYFGSAGSYDFSGGMWTSPIGVGGGGLGAWSMTPSNGQEMDFAWAGGAFEGGMVAIFWYVGGVVKGSMNFVVAGLGGGGGKGSGTWTKA